MSIKVRVGNEDDIPAIVEVECSDVETWYHFSPEGRGEPASYDELTPFEREMHGGPWMDITELTRYWKCMEMGRLGIVMLVAELDGKVVGHLDVLFSEETQLGQFLFLDVLMVHRAYRRKGVAMALIDEARRIAEGRRVKLMLVTPQEYEGPSGRMYRKYGFEKAFDVYSLKAHTDNQQIPSGVQIAPISYKYEALIKTHAMVCGWYNISVKTWHSSMNPDLESMRFFSCHELAISVITKERIYFLHIGKKVLPSQSSQLCLWAPMPLKEEELGTVVRVAKASASWLGVETLATKTTEKYVGELVKAGFTIKTKEEPYLAFYLNRL